MIKQRFIKEFVKTTHNETQHQNSAHIKTVLHTVMECSWPMHNVVWHIYTYHNIDNPIKLYYWKFL